jgi:hypothetical protein
VTGGLKNKDIKNPRKQFGHVVFCMGHLNRKLVQYSINMVRGGKVSPLADKLDDFQLVE